MKHRSATRRQGGFTLVEIAIVLMIVGLLIGGILRGQELIQSARVRNIIDQKSAVQTAYIGFLDRYRMLPGDLTAPQAAIVGGSTLGGAGTAGDGLITPGSESTLFFQNLTTSGFLSCAGCTNVALVAGGAGPRAISTNSPINVYGAFLTVGHMAATAVDPGGDSWFDPTAVTRMTLLTGSSVSSQVMAEIDRKSDDGFPGTGQLRFGRSWGATQTTMALCAPGLAVANQGVPWANPDQANCEGAWLF